ncbi:MAG TPA: efflux transporter outer membrane subunit [Sphingomonadaceae bacterium]|nr:efflux transporter outer membrane subunit [Sphingomonadaceae bacterium]
MRAHAVLLIGVAALAACAGPRAVTVPPPVPPALSAFTAGPFGTPAGEWWRERLSDPGLVRLIEAALANSPDLAAASARIEGARASLRARNADRLPNIGGSAGATFSRSADAESIGGGDPPPGIAIDRERVTGRVGLDASYDLDLFGGLRADRRAAAARLDAAGADAAAVRLALVTDVARNYVAAAAANARAGVARDNVASARDLLGITRVRVRAGLVAGIDTTRAESLLAEASATLPPLEGERGARIAALATLTALSPAEIGPLVARAPAAPRFGGLSVGIPSDLLARRPDILAAIGRVAASDADVASALAARYPRLTVTGAVGLVATSLGRFFSGDALSLAAGPGLAGPLFDFGRNRAAVAGARARTDEAVADYRAAVLRAFGEVEQNLALAAAAERQRLALERLVAANADTASIARVQYRRGLTDFLGVLDVEQALFRSRDAAIAAAGRAADVQIALFRAVGGDLSAASSSR